MPKEHAVEERVRWEREVEYEGYEIFVKQEYVVLGDDPLAEAIEGYTADVRKPLAVQDDPDGRIVYDFPFDHMASTFHGATHDEVVEQAKTFIDANGRKRHLA